MAAFIVLATLLALATLDVDYDTHRAALPI